VRKDQIYAYDNASPAQGERLRRLCAALRPGGLLVAEEMDFRAVAPDPTMDDDARELFARGPIVAAGLLSAAEMEHALALFGEDRFSSLSPVIMAATGTREG
jgi:hypothetical protein